MQTIKSFISDYSITIDLKRNFIEVFQKSKWLFWITISYIVGSIPNYFSIIYDGLDPSWVYCINSAWQKGAVWGDNLFFTYGPMGFLDHVCNTGNNLAVASVLWAMILYVNLCVLFNLANKIKITVTNLITATIGAVFNAASLFNSANNCRLSYVILICLAVIWMGEKRFIPVYNILTTLLFFTKFSNLAMVIISVTVFTFFSVILKKSLKRSLLLWLFAPLSAVVYIIYNPSFKDLGRYLKGILEISSGYSSAMSSSIEGSDESVIWVIIGAAACLTVFFCMWKISKEKACLFAGLTASLAVTYKEGFVRHGGHFCFQMVMSVFSILFLAINFDELMKSEGKAWRKNTVMAGTFIISLICVSKTGDIFSAAFSSLNSNLFQAPLNMMRIAEDKGEHAARLSDSFKQEIGSATVASFPYELTYMVDEELNFSWMPIIQNYSSYTVWCDQKNADYFLNNMTAPSYIVFRFDTIDGRFPLIETPLTWNAIKKHYYCVMEENGNYLLKRNEKPQNIESTGDLIALERIEKAVLKDSAENESIYFEVPEGAEYLMLNADLGFSGNLAKLFWKIPEVILNVKCSNGDEYRGRILPEMLQNPIKLSDIARYGDYNAVVSGIGSLDIESIAFSGEGAGYYKSISVSWYFGGKNGRSSMGSEEDFFDSYTLLSETPHMCIDEVKTEASDITISGWCFASWEGEQCVAVSVDGELYPLYKVKRDDVCKFLELNEKLNVGIMGKLPITEKCRIIVYDPVTKVYCAGDINNIQIDKECVSIECSSMGSEEDFFDSYTLLSETPHMCIDEVKTEASDITISGWCFASWDGEQCVAMSVDGELYPLYKVKRDDVCKSFGLNEKLDAGIMGKLPITEKCRIIVYDPVTKVYCAGDINNIQIDKECVSIGRSSMGSEEDFFDSYTLLSETPHMYIDDVKTEASDITISGWCFASWEGKQRVAMSVDGELYPLYKVKRDDVCKSFGLNEKLNVGIMGKLPITEKCRIIVYDPVTKVYCAGDINNVQIDKECVSIGRSSMGSEEDFFDSYTLLSETPHMCIDEVKTEASDITISGWCFASWEGKQRVAMSVDSELYPLYKVKRDDVCKSFGLNEKLNVGIMGKLPITEKCRIIVYDPVTKVYCAGDINNIQIDKECVSTDY